MARKEPTSRQSPAESLWQWVDAARHDPLQPISVVVPSNFVGLQLRQLRGARPGVRFLVEARLHELIAAGQLESRGLRRLGAHSQRHLVRRLLRESAPPLREFSGSRAAVTELAELLPTWVASGANLPDPLRDLAARYREHTQGTYGALELAREAAELLSAGKHAEPVVSYQPLDATGAIPSVHRDTQPDAACWEFVSVASEHDEAEWIADSIAALEARGGIAALAPRGGERLLRLRQAILGRGVAVHGVTSRTLEGTRYARAVRSAQTLLSTDCSREALADWLWLREESEALALLRISPIIRGWSAWLAALEGRIETAAALIAIRDRKHGQGWRGFAERCSEYARLGGLVGRLDEADELARDALLGLERLGNVDASPDEEDCWAALEDAWSQPIPEGRFGDGVFVGTFASAHALEFEHVFALGMDEAAMTPPRPSPWALLGGATPAPREPEADLMNVLAGTKSATLSYSRLGASGGNLWPSPVWMRLLRDALGEPEIRPAHELAELEAEQLLYLRERARQPTIDPGLARAREAIAARHSSTFGVFDGGPGGEPSLARLANQVSASALETFATCPFRFWLRYRLRLKDPEEPEDRADLRALDVGSWFHQTMARWFQEDPEGAQPELAAKIGRQELERVRAPEDSIWLDLQREQLLEMVLDTAKQDSEERADGVQAVAAEREFSDLLIRLSGTELRLHGTIDRIDALADGLLRITDFKTGSSVGRVKVTDPTWKGEVLQWAIYARAVQQRGAHARYWYVRDRRIVQAPDPEALQARLDEVLELVVSQDSMGAYPTNPKACTHCAFNRLCPPDRASIAARRTDDPRGEPYRRLRGQES